MKIILRILDFMQPDRIFVIEKPVLTLNGKADLETLVIKSGGRDQRNKPEISHSINSISNYLWTLWTEQ